MKLSTLTKFFIVSVSLMFLVPALPLLAESTASQPDTSTPLKVLLKIRELDKTLDQIDAYAKEAGGPSATAMLRGMLQGTDWIDMSRAIVLGFDFSGETPAGAALIPFKTKNEQFQSTFGAAAAEDYYLLPLPPGKGGGISLNAEQTLVKASAVLPDTAVSMELAVADLLAGNRAKIDSLLETMEKQMADQAHDPMAPGPEEVDAMVSGMLDTLGQLKTLSLGIDLGRNDLKLAGSAVAVGGTQMDKLFNSAGKTSRFSTYAPAGDFIYRTKSLDVTTMIKIFEAGFGKMYQHMGLDFAQLADITQYFTGESAGGMTYEKTDMKMELVHLLKADAPLDRFLEEIYIPWMMDYGKNLTEMYEKAGMADAGQPFTRLPDIVIDGYKVAGIKYRMPVMMTPSGTSDDDIKPVIIETTFRMTTVGDMLLTASDQNGMAALIGKTKSLQKMPDGSPLMTAALDLEAYFKYMAEISPETASLLSDLPKPGKIFMETDFNKGKASASARMNTDFIKGMIAMAAKARQKAGATEPAPQSPPPPPTVKESASEPQIKNASYPEPVVKDADYWIDKGNLVATYGNDKAAVRFYQEALKLSPNDSGAHFNLGISYGELGQYDDAIAAIDQAIRLDPKKGNYYYGRGRVYLLAGDREKAMKDLNTAAEMGHTDAREYLNRWK